LQSNRAQAEEDIRLARRQERRETGVYSSAAIAA